MDNDHGEPDTFQMPSRAQELALAILPIASAILSIMGSSIIIYMSVSTKRHRKWTPYTRLLLFLSFYDIIASATLGMASFLRDKETSSRPFSFGSSGTCTMVGFFNQLSYGTLFYNGSLSLYFLLTARFGYSNAYISRCIEPWMHFIANGFAFCTSIVALALGAYGEMTHGSGCWIADYPRGCGEGSECTSRLIGWIYFGLPSISIFILVCIFNSMIFVFVRRHKIPEAKRTSKQQIDRDESYTDEDETDGRPKILGSIKEKTDTNDSALESGRGDSQNTQSRDTQSRDQARRLSLVSTQAFLYVAFFLMCNVWTGAVGIIESGGSTREEEMQLVVDYYAFFLLQAVLAPLQGVFNMAVYIRPKLHLCATAFPGETRLWILRRTILGARIKPTRSSHHGPLRVINGPRSPPADPNDHKRQRERGATNEPTATRIPRDMISSVTASEGDFNSELCFSNSTDERWANKEKGFSSILASLPIRFESLRNPKSSILEVISENEPSNFEPISRISISEELAMDMSSGDFFPVNAERRWASDSSGSSTTTPGGRPMTVPKREDSHVEEPDQSTSFRHLFGSSEDIIEQVESSSVDQPIKVPQRRSSGGNSSPKAQRKVSKPTSSSRHTANETDTNEREIVIPADMPITAPVRSESLDEETFDKLLS